MAESLPIPANGDTINDTKKTPPNDEKRLSLSLCIVAVLKSEPDYTFTILDVVDRVHGKHKTVTRTLDRLSSAGKGSGPVRKVGRGLFCYAPEKTQGSFTELICSASWKVENLVFVKSVSSEAYSIPVSPIREPETSRKETPDPRIPTPRLGYPAILPTGQQVSWDIYKNGTEIIRISANGKPPLSADSVILVIGMLKKFGLDETWSCTSLELNVDSRKHRIDGSHSLQLTEGSLLKAYMHGYTARIEIADRRPVPAREIWDLFHAISGSIDSKEALRKAEALEARLKQNEKETRLALNIARTVRDREPQCNCTGQAPTKRRPPAPLKRAATPTRKQAPEAGGGEPVS